MPTFKTVLAASFLLIGSNVWAAVDPAGTWTVKAKVIMSTCPDQPMNRTTTEQWIINPSNDGYQIQVIGNSNQKLNYVASMVGTQGNDGIFFGRYIEGNVIGKTAISDVQLAFSSDNRVSGMRLDAKFPPKECTAASMMEFKKLN